MDLGVRVSISGDDPQPQQDEKHHGEDRQPFHLTVVPGCRLEVNVELSGLRRVAAVEEVAPRSRLGSHA